MWRGIEEEVDGKPWIRPRIDSFPFIEGVPRTEYDKALQNGGSCTVWMENEEKELVEIDGVVSGNVERCWKK